MQPFFISRSSFLHFFLQIPLNLSHLGLEYRVHSGGIYKWVRLYWQSLLFHLAMWVIHNTYFWHSKCSSSCISLSTFFCDCRNFYTFLLLLCTSCWFCTSWQFSVIYLHVQWSLIEPRFLLNNININHSPGASADLIYISDTKNLGSWECRYVNENQKNITS